MGKIPDRFAGFRRIPVGAAMGSGVICLNPICRIFIDSLSELPGSWVGSVTKSKTRLLNSTLTHFWLKTYIPGPQYSRGDCLRREGALGRPNRTPVGICPNPSNTFSAPICVPTGNGWCFNPSALAFICNYNLFFVLVPPASPLG